MFRRIEMVIRTKEGLNQDSSINSYPDDDKDKRFAVKNLNLMKWQITAGLHCHSGRWPIVFLASTW